MSYYSRIRKNVTEKQRINKPTENRELIDRDHSNPVDRWVEWANKWQGPAFGARSGVRNNITHRKQTIKEN